MVATPRALVLPAGALKSAYESPWLNRGELFVHPLTATRSRRTEGSFQPRSRMVAR